MKNKPLFSRLLAVLVILALSLSFLGLPIHANAVASIAEELPSNIYKNVEDPSALIGELDWEAASSLEVELHNLESNGVNRDFHIPNLLTIKLIPGKNGFVVSVHNVGVDALSSISMTVVITDYNGNRVTSNTFADVNIPVGNTVYTWILAKSNTIKENATLSGYAIDGTTYQLGPISTYRYNFAGGAYGTLSAYEGERHHIPSKSASNLTAYSGPAIRMLLEDHKKTASYGSSSAAVAFRAKEAELIADGKFAEAMQMGIDDIRDLFGTKYDDAISEMIAYAVNKGYISAGSVS